VQNFTAFFVVLEKNVFRTRLPENIDPRVACDLLRAVAPEKSFPVQIESADPDFEPVDDVGVNLGSYLQNRGMRPIADADG
jgi:hypothetical protein